MFWSRKKPEGEKARKDGLPQMPETIYLAKAPRQIDWKRVFFLLLGIALFSVVYSCPSWPDAVDASGRHVPLTHQGKATFALLLLALTWWIFEVVPVGVTGIMIGVIQALFLIRPAQAAFANFMHPSVWFIFGSLVIGLAFTKTGLTKRVAYRMLTLVGERTSMIFLGCMILTAALTHIMAHSAVAASVFPLLRAVYSLYEEDSRPTRFGKALFISMAFTCGAGSIITLLGSARGALAVGFFQAYTGREISFFELSAYMFPLGWSLVILLWAFFMIFYGPEKKTIPGLHERAKMLYSRLGPMSPSEMLTVAIVFAALCLLSVYHRVPALENADKSAIILVSTVLFFVLRILAVKDLQELPWNLVLLFGAAMSIGFCLKETRAADWLAVQYLGLFRAASPMLFVMVTAFLVLVTINWMMNVAVIAIFVPVSLVAASQLGVAPEVMLFASLAAAGMPFMLLYGSAPNVIAYGSGLFTQGEFFKIGFQASILLMVVLGFFVWGLWPILGMPILVNP